MITPCFSSQVTFLLADLSSGYSDSMIEVVTGIVPISLNCLSIPQYSNILNTKGNITSFSIQNIAVKTISKPNDRFGLNNSDCCQLILSNSHYSYVSYSQSCPASDGWWELTPKSADHRSGIQGQTPWSVSPFSSPSVSGSGSGIT